VLLIDDTTFRKFLFQTARIPPYIAATGKMLTAALRIEHWVKMCWVDSEKPNPDLNT